MKYSPEEILEYVKDEDVKFIRLSFCDAFGVQKNIAIMPSELERAFEQGIAIDASSISGFGDEMNSDLFLHPDTDTLALLPWRPEHGAVVRMYCGITYPDGNPIECDTRTFLKKAVDKAAKKGYSFSFGSELEFYLFELDDKGNPTNIPHDRASYMDIAPADKGENVRREICLTLERMGIRPESSHHEMGPGQNEINFRFSDALSAADNAMTFRMVVKTIAQRNGLYADFSPLPIKDAPGNGFHISVSVHSDKKPEGVSGRDADSLTNMRYMIAGILEKIEDMTLFLNPQKDSYLRLGHNKAPKYISWSHENRSQLIRIPAATGEYQRAQLRSPDPTANPYLAFGLMIYAGLHGIENKIQLPPPADINLFKADKLTLSKFGQLPDSLDVARLTAGDSSFIKEYVPEEILNLYKER
ncbi:MAG: glutamine synthetase [Lachnospiraceae bacterium]|nr:glutamine synthetase [Lachnospiraceae bacterium]